MQIFELLAELRKVVEKNIERLPAASVDEIAGAVKAEQQRQIEVLGAMLGIEKLKSIVIASFRARRDNAARPEQLTFLGYDHVPPKIYFKGKLISILNLSKGDLKAEKRAIEKRRAKTKPKRYLWLDQLDTGLLKNCRLTTTVRAGMERAAQRSIEKPKAASAGA
jgi:hypothetical protein